jgi:hypothetical protein
MDDPKIKAYTVGELARFYHVDLKTFKKWVRPYQQYIGERKGWYYTNKQVTIIFEKLGEP